MENLKELDISNTNIVSGGASYYDGYTTKNNIIGTYMFSGLSNLEQIKTPQSITAIYSYAFGGCISLTEYVFTERIREIGTAAFFNCQSLKSAIIPSNITMIRYNAFAGCENLKSVTFSDSDEEIFVDTPFIQCPIETIYVGRNIKYYEFDGSPFAYLTTLKDVTLSKHAFLTISGWMSICFRCIIQNLKRVTCVTDSFNDMTQWWNKKKS